MNRPLMVLCVATLLSPGAIAAVLPQSVDGQQPVRFNRDVRPLLADRCFHCHGPDKGKRKAGLRLDRSDGAEGAYRVRDGAPAIQPGSLADSALWYRLTTADRDDRMPPVESHKAPLNAEETAIIQRWIEQGAEYEDHWAFVMPKRPSVEPASHRSAAQTIDGFVARKLRARGMQPSSRADRRTLIRRVSLDLTGLPPTRAEIATFLRDDSPDAYGRLVDRLLARPQYGEHMAKYWLDLVRFADTNGVHHDHYREMTPYRDWVIRAFDDNLPYDRFVTDQLAGDLHAEPTDDQRVASGFNRLHMIIDVGTALPEESYTRNVVDRVTAVGTAFLGLTVQCAVCHDHKYDPIRQKDFYQLFAFFNNLDAMPETGGRGTPDFRRGLQQPYISLATAEQKEAVARMNRELAAADARVGELKSAQKDAIDDPRKQELGAQLASGEKERKRLRGARDKLLRTIPAAMVMKERKDVRPAHILVRGAYDNPGERVTRDTPAFLPSMRRTEGVPTRLDLARWLLSPEHPLTARVAVNRIWQQLCGVGIVKTAEDFGTQGEWPSHPELLDHLAMSFVESGWDVKALVRRIVTSTTYQQSSAATPAAYTADPENRLLARGSRFRMDSEMIRDQILATSGLLNPRLYGRSVKPPQPLGLWKAVSLPSSFPRTYAPDTGDAIYRRSVYTFWKRGMPPPQMSLLNAPTRESCTARRERTNTPLQALLLMNETEYFQAARHLASTTLSTPGSHEQRLRAIYETITSQLPDPRETAELLDSVRDLEAMYAEAPGLAAKLCDGATLDTGQAAAELAAWTVLVNTIYNLDITKTRG